MKINERLNVEQPNLRVITIKNENWEDKASKFIYIKREIWESAKLRVVRNIEWTNNFKICQFLCGCQNLERQNIERPIFRNFKITNIKITKNELFHNFIFDFIFSLFINYLHNLIIFQIVTFNAFFIYFSVLNFENSLIFQIKQFRIFDHFLNQSIIAIWKMANFPN